jgi:hypothetical protein
MDTEQRDIEAYAKTSSAGAVVSLLSRTIGQLRSKSPPEDALQIYEFEGVCVVLQPSEDGFLSVWVRGSNAWSSCSDLGRHLANELRCVVRCEPGRQFPAVSPQSDVFLEIEGSRESLISWG